MSASGSPRRSPRRAEADSDAEAEALFAELQQQQETEQEKEKEREDEYERQTRAHAASSNRRSQMLESRVPEVCRSQQCALGVDEAGRGPVCGTVATVL